MALIADSLKSTAIEELISLSEEELQSTVVEPLLRHLGFTSVRAVSGANDCGKDLVALRPEPFGPPKLYAVQIKKLKISGKFADRTGFSHVINQLRQLFREPVVCPDQKDRRLPDRCLFITPYPLTRAALESAFQQFVELERQEIMVVDGSRLIDEVIRHMPQVLGRLSSTLNYRLTLATHLDVMQEYTAFDLSSGPSLSRLYVELSYSGANSELMALGATAWPEFEEVTVKASASDVAELDKTCRTLLGSRFSIKDAPLGATSSLDLARPSNIAEASLIHGQSAPQLVSVDLSNLGRELKRQFGRFREGWSQMFREGMDFDGSAALLAEASRLNTVLADLRRTPLGRGLWNHFWKSTALESKPHGGKARILTDIQAALLIFGGAGAGKTTLLRRMARELATKRDAQLPVFVYLNRVRENSLGAILDAALLALTNQGYGISPEEFQRDLIAGRFRLLLDGIDETGENAQEFLATIERLNTRYPRACVVATCRDTYSSTGPDGFICMHLRAFTDKQIAEFVSHWFASEPSNAAVVIKAIETLPGLREIARTPINCALLCSLVQANRDIPTNEVELYEARFDLLLGRWERAKGMTTIPTEVRKCYYHFLEELAADYQIHERRVAPRADVVALAAKCIHPRYHRSGDQLLDDCIHRGVLFHEGDYEISFGHFAYQEFLTAKWLRAHQPGEFILSKLCVGWWSNTLRFYATISGDISSLIEVVFRHQLSMKQQRHLQDLLALAPFTTLGTKRLAEALQKSKKAPALAHSRNNPPRKRPAK